MQRIQLVRYSDQLKRLFSLKGPDELEIGKTIMPTLQMDDLSNIEYLRLAGIKRWALFATQAAVAAQFAEIRLGLRVPPPNNATASTIWSIRSITIPNPNAAAMRVGILPAASALAHGGGGSFALDPRAPNPTQVGLGINTNSLVGVVAATNAYMIPTLTTLTLPIQLVLADGQGGGGVGTFNEFLFESQLANQELSVLFVVDERPAEQSEF